MSGPISNKIISLTNLITIHTTIKCTIHQRLLTIIIFQIIKIFKGKIYKILQRQIRIRFIKLKTKKSLQRNQKLKTFNPTMHLKTINPNRFLMILRIKFNSKKEFYNKNLFLSNLDLILNTRETLQMSK
jgi:hypothetical protein